MAELADMDVDPHLKDGLDDQDGGFHGSVFTVVRMLVSWLAVCAIVLGGVFPYIPQYRTVQRTRNAEGFSPFVCLVLLVANILRILFWFGKRYELPLLLQSCVMIATMLVMMHQCVRVKAEQQGSAVKRRIFDLEYKYFWRWSKFRDYCYFIGLLTLVGGALTASLSRIQLYVELLGFASLLSEAMLGTPQLWRNFFNKSTEGMSVQMVFMWFCGDTFKTVYFLLRHSPLQFWVCGGLQIAIDILILCQVLLYREHRVQLAPGRPHGSTVRATKISLT